MPTTTPTVYQDTDTSAPAKNIAAGNVISILNACLVNGYGSKTAAGWTVPYTGTNIAVYRMSTTSPATGFYLYVDDSNASYTQFRGAESATDAIIGDLVNPFPTLSQVASGSGLYLPRSGSGGDWNVIADSRAFYMWCNGANVPLHIMFFGDYQNYGSDAFGCAMIAAGSSSSTGANCILGNCIGTINQGLTGHYMARDTSGNLSVNFGKMGLGTNGVNSSVVANYPNPGNNKLLIFPYEINNGVTINAIRGRMPGLNCILHQTASINNRDTFSIGSSNYIALGCNTTNSFVAVQTDSWTR